MPQKCKHVTVRLYDTEKVLAAKLAKYHKVAGRGRLLAKYMREDVEKIKLERSAK